jgi:hypothetical protein
MSALDNIPSNKNFLSPLNFKFTLKRAPHINFFLQKINLPQVSINPTPEYSNPLINIPLPGEFVTFSPLSISFKFLIGLRLLVTMEEMVITQNYKMLNQELILDCIRIYL